MIQPSPKKVGSRTILPSSHLARKAFIGIGSNIGNSPDNCIIAIRKIIGSNRSVFTGVSSLYVSSPVSHIEQPDFINCAIAVQWKDTAFELLRCLLEIEHHMGRVRSIRHGPRLIDLDILLFGNVVLESPDLVIPHPELRRRKFAMLPCVEIDPDIIHPLLERPLSQCLEESDADQRIALFMPAAEVMEKLNLARDT
jgi:2-amino-4-hydroxy-6-hydroxymethyldihydropteridine diphosphokinase